MTTEATPGELGSTEGLGQADPERAAFARWCRENGHGELDDMLTPLDRSLRALMWPVWRGAVAAERERGRIDDGQGDRIDALLLRAKDALARSERPKGCGGTYAVPAAEWLALQEEVMHRLREHAREACGA